MVILDRMNRNMECKLHRIIMFSILQQINRNDHAIHLKLLRVTANRTTHNFLFIKSRTIYIMPKRCYLLSFVFFRVAVAFHCHIEAWKLPSLFRQHAFFFPQHCSIIYVCCFEMQLEDFSNQSA